MDVRMSDRLASGRAVVDPDIEGIGPKLDHEPLADGSDQGPEISLLFGG